MAMAWGELPERHRYALKAARYLGGSVSRLMPDRFVSGVSTATLDDLADLGLMRRRWSRWEITLLGWQVLGDRRLRG
jgi:hypothetical protein